jgi:hypothetical protein
MSGLNNTKIDIHRGQSFQIKKDLLLIGGIPQNIQDNAETKKIKNPRG